MEKLSNDIALKVASELNLNNDRKDVIAYGTFALLQTILSIVLIIIFGLVFHVAVEALIVSFVASILRKYSGGAHATSPGRCATIGTIVCIGQAFIILLIISPLVNDVFLILVGIVVFVLSYCLIYKLAPVHSSAKPIRKKEKRDRMKKVSILILSAYLIIALLNIILYAYVEDKRFAVYTLCIYVGIAWQVFTLTRSGHLAISKIDGFLNQILIVKRGRG